jgi:N-acetylglutamate synthase-like GNAT family acetyltransferase
MNKIEELRWIRTFSPDLIPKYLVEQVKKRDYKAEDFYEYQRSLCLRMTKEGPTLNPLSHLYLLANTDNLVKGFLWFTVDPLSKAIVIQTYTVDKEYWGAGGSVKKLADHMKEIRKKAKLNKIYWITDYPKHSQRHGFRMSKSVLMEYSEEEDGQNIHGGSDTRGKRGPADSRTETIPERDSGTECGAGEPSIRPDAAAV